MLSHEASSASHEVQGAHAGISGNRSAAHLLAGTLSSKLEHDVEFFVLF